MSPTIDPGAVEPLRLEPASWDALVDLATSQPPDAEGRRLLARAGVVDADGRTMTAATRAVVTGIETALMSVTARTISPAFTGDLMLFAGVRTTTAAERQGPTVLVDAFDTSAAPNRLAEFLGLGPRDFVSVEPVPAPEGLWNLLIDPAGSEHIPPLVEDLTAQFALDAPRVADALEQGRWRLSLTSGWTSDASGTTLALLDTQYGLFQLEPGTTTSRLVPLTTMDAWMVLSTLLPAAA